MVWKITFKNIKTSSLLIQHETTTDGVKDRETREELFTHTHTQNWFKDLKTEISRSAACVEYLHLESLLSFNKAPKQTNQNLLIPKAW